MAAKTYSIDDVYVMLNGFRIEGFGDDAVTISWPEDSVILTEGTNGEIAASLKPNNIAEVTLRLMQTSLSNDLIWQMWRMFQNTRFGSWKLAIKDGRGTTVFVSTQAFLSKPPEVAFSKEAGTREYVFRCVVDKAHLGGNIVA